MANKTSLRAFLKAASITCAFISCAADTHAGGAYFTGNHPAPQNDAYNSTLNWTPTPGGLAINAYNGGVGNWIVLNGNDNILANANIEVRGLNINGKTGVRLVVSNSDSSIGSIVDVLGTGSTLNIEFATGHTLTLDGLTTNAIIPSHNYTGLSKVNLDNKGTLLLASVNQHGIDLSNTMIYGDGTLKVTAQEGGIFGFPNESTVLGGTLGFNGITATSTIIDITAGKGSPNDLAVGADIILNAIDTTATVSLAAGVGRNSSAMAADTGNGGNIYVAGSITSGGVMTLVAGNGGNKLGNVTGNGGGITIEGLVKTLGANILITPGSNGTGNANHTDGLGGGIIFNGGIDLSSGGNAQINPGDGLISVKGNILLGNNTSFTAPANLSIKATGPTLITAAPNANSTFAANINADGNPLTFGTTTAGNTLAVTGSISSANIINITGAGAVSFGKNISPSVLQINSLGTITLQSTLAGNVLFNEDGVLSLANGGAASGTIDSKSASAYGTVYAGGNITIASKIGFTNPIKTLKVSGNPNIGSSVRVNTVDFSNGGILGMSNGSSLSYSTFANTGGTSQINATGTNSITSTGSGGAVLPLITISGSTTLSGNINAAQIQATGSGVIILNNATVSGSATGAVAVSSGASSINGANSASLNFTSSGGQLAITSANQINNVQSVTSNGGGTLILSGGTLACDIAASANPLTSLQLTGGSTLSNNGKNIYAGSLMPIATGVNLNLTRGSISSSAGNASSPFSNITLNNFTVSSDMYAVNFNINGEVKLNNSNLNGAVNLAGGSSLDATNGKVSGNITGSGNITLGQAALSNPIGASGSNLGVVTLTPAQHTLSSNIYANSVIADNSSLILNNSVEISNLSAQNLTLTTNTNSLTLPSGGNLTGLTNLNLTLDSLTTNTTPYINITGGALSLSDLRISIADNVGVGNSGAKILVIGGSNNYTGTPTIVDSKLITWTYDNSTGLLSSGLNQKAVDKVVESLQAQIPDIGKYFDPGNTGDAFLAEDLIASATIEQAVEIVTQIQSVTRDVAQQATLNDATLDNIRNVLDQQTYNYFSDESSYDDQLSAEADLGIAAGEEEDKSRRVWISTVKTGKSDIFSEPAKFNKFRIVGFSGSGFGGFSDLGRIKGASGNRTKTYGCSTGIDTRISEKWMAGAAFTYTENTTSMHNTLKGSTYFSKSWVGTLYGLYSITNSWSVRTGLSYGNTKNINKARRLVALPAVYSIAYATYNSQFISPDVSISYRIALPNQISFIPSVGLQYVYTLTGTYDEKGARPLNMMVKKKPEKGVFSGNIGLGLSTSFKIGETLIKPEIHGSFKRALRGRNPTTLSKLDGAASFIQTRAHPTKKVTYSVGGSVAIAVNKTLDLGVGYDASLGEKFIGHRGSLKVRVNL